MPVLRQLLPDPTDLVLQGEQLRGQASPLEALEAFEGRVVPPAAIIALPAIGNSERVLANLAGLPPMAADVGRSAEFVIFPGIGRAQNGVNTPCGALVPNEFRRNLHQVGPSLSSERWQIVDTTVDELGDPLGGCRVLLFDVSRLAVDGAPIAGDVISNLGTGQYVFTGLLPQKYQAMAFKPGAPDQAGASVATLTPTQV